MNKKEHLHAWWRLLRGDRPIGFFLLLWPVLWSLWLAHGGVPSLRLLAIFAAGTFLMRAAGCIANDCADRSFDARVQRTRDRPLVTGAVRLQTAILLCALLLALAFGLVLLTNRLTVLLALVAAALSLVYPFSKRWFALPQLFLGAAFAWSVPMVFAATNGAAPAEAWWLFTAVLLWTLCYDTFYAMADREEDRLIGVHSSALLFGRMDRRITAMLQSLTLAVLLYCAALFSLGVPYFVALFAVALLFIRQQQLIRRREAADCLRAFVHNTWVGAAVFAGILLSLAH